MNIHRILSPQVLLKGARLLLILFLFLSLSFSSPTVPYAAEDEITDEELKAFKEDVFKEDDNGVPQLKADDIDEKWMTEFYGRPKALAAIQALFTAGKYSAINDKMGEIRNKANIEAWAEVVSKTGVAVELHNAGKMNGALSDLDNATIILADSIPGRPDLKTPKQILDHMKALHADIWQKRFADLPPSKFDMEHFPGPKFDWRMSDMHWAEFNAKMKGDIVELFNAKTYFAFGGYEPQVYGRYVVGGDMTSIEPDLTAQSKVEGIPDGVVVSKVKVLVKENLETREASVVYSKVPINVDRTGSLESVLHNYFWSERYSSTTMKRAKMLNRIIDTGLGPLTNLMGFNKVEDVSFFTRLVAEGREGAIDHHLKKLFKEMESNKSLPPEIKSVDNIKKIIVRTIEIELDKILRGFPEGGRPDHWSERWRGRVPLDINELGDKLEYFKEEAEAIKQEEADFIKRAPPDVIIPPLTDEQVAAMAEERFMQKARAVARVSAAVAAKRVLTGLFTKDGFARLKVHFPDPDDPNKSLLDDPNKAKSLLAERIKSLHAALIFIGDEAMIRYVLDSVPDEAKSTVQDLVEIARKQRAEIAGRTSIVEKYKKGEANLTREMLDESDRVLNELTNRLGIDPDDISTDSRAVASRLSPGDRAIDPDLYAKRFNQITLEHEMMKQGMESERVRSFFQFDLSGRGIVDETLSGFKDIGSVLTLTKIMNANARGDYAAVKREAVESVVENVPLFGSQYYNLMKGVLEAQKGNYFELGKYVGLNGLKLAGLASEEAALWTTFGMSVFTVYLIEQQLAEFGWNVVGQPNQDRLVMLVLNGDEAPFEQEPLRQSIFTGLGFSVADDLKEHYPEMLSTMKDIAILKKKVERPNYPEDLLKLYFKARFLSRASRQAGEGNFSIAGGEHSPWAKERTRILKGYIKNADYWLRRIYLYHFTDLAIPKFRQQFLSDRSIYIFGEEVFDWAKLQKEPPTFLKHVSPDELIKRYPRAYNRYNRKQWDHEMIWLTEYFGQWVEEWENTLHSAFPYSPFWITVRTLSPRWKQAVIGELIRYYKEGKMWGMIPESVLARPEVREGVKRNRRNIENGSKRGLSKIIRDARRKYLDRILKYEQLMWHPKMADRFVDGVIEAGIRQPRFAPPPPKLEIRIPRPVFRPGRRLYFDATVRGNILQLPGWKEMGEKGEGKIEVAFEKINESKGKRPKEVLRHDIKRLFYFPPGDKELNFIKAKAIFTLKYKSRPELTLQADKVVYVVDYLKDEDREKDKRDEEDKKDDGGTGSGTGSKSVTDVKPSPGGGRKDDGDKEKCEEVKKTTKGIEKDVEKAEKGAKELETELDKIKKKIKIAGGKVHEAADHSDAAYRASLQVVEAKQQMERLALAVCEKAEKIKNAKSPEEIRRLSREQKEDYRKVRDLKNKARRALQKAKKEAAKAEKISKGFQPLVKKLEKLKERVGKQSSGLETVKVEIGKAREGLTAVGVAAAGSSAPTEETSDCKKEAGKDVGSNEKDLPAVEERLKKITSELTVSVSAREWIKKLGKEAKEARASADTAEVYYEALAKLASDAGKCTAAVGNLPMHAYFIISIEGDGYVPLWAGAVHTRAGMNEAVLGLKRGENLTAKLKEKEQALLGKGDVCDRVRPAICPCKYPIIWNGGPKVTVVDGPFVKHSQAIDRKLKDTWRTTSNDGTYDDLKGVTGCN